MNNERIEYVQCTHCGEIYDTQIQCDDDDLYVHFKCKKCHKDVNHLRCGNDWLDIYMYYDPSLDKRFY